MKKRSKLKRYEYQEIFEKYFDFGWRKSQIAKYLGRNKSTISRALSRDLHPSPFLTTYEKAMYAWEKSRKRMCSSRKRLRLKTERIRKLVIYLLCRKNWSPEEISDFLKEHGLLVSAKAIYNFIKNERPELVEYLDLRGRKRRQRVAHRRGIFKSGVPNKKSIHQRPPIDGAGHWEIDTVHSVKGSKGGVLTLRELSSKKSYYFLIPDLTAKSVMRVLFPFFHGISVHLRLTLTSDNGSEFAELYKLEKAFAGFKVYYCDPYKAYQRGSVENANRELRWYFPKKTNFSEVSEKELRIAQDKINGKPLKINNRRSPSTVFKEFLEAA
jgi:IS30 family transposase